MNWHHGRRLAFTMTTSVVVVAFTMLAAASGWGQDQPAASKTKTKSKSKVDHKINAKFHKAKAKDYVKRFESEKRENYAHRHEIVDALELKPGMSVADVGAGTGFFARLFARKVGPKGTVYAVDVSRPFLDHIEKEARKQGLKQLKVVQGSQDSTNLPADSVDRVFLSDVYHHLENPQKSLASIRKALRPGGRLVVIEFDRVEGKSSKFILKHVRASKAVFRKEIESAGFRVIPTPNPPKLKQNFFLQFEEAEVPEIQTKKPASPN